MFPKREKAQDREPYATAVVHMNVNRKPSRFLWKVAAAGVGLWVASQFISSTGQRSPHVQAAPLLEKVQALGELHAVKYTYRDVHEFQTAREATPWLASIPGGNEVVNAATTNTAVMSYTGTIEAGVDLAQAKIAKTETGVTVTLPAPRIYPANVSADVHSVKRGLFWRDQAITTTAIEDAKARLHNTSLRQGILEEAKTNVRKQVGALVKDLAGTEAVITFEGEPAS